MEKMHLLKRPTEKFAQYSMLLVSLGLFQGMLLWGCAHTQAKSPSKQAKDSSTASKVGEGGATETSSPVFANSTELDRLLVATAQPLPAIKPAAQATNLAIKNPTSTSPTKAAHPATSTDAYCVQIDALTDIDAAEARKAQLGKILGYRIDMIFEAPYYKIRVGSFATKREAEDRLIELAGKNLQGLIMRK